MEQSNPLSPYIGDRSPKILVVDDEPANLELVTGMLGMWGCIVQTAVNGREAMAAARAFSPDAILLDVRMPGESGFEVGDRLRRDPLTRDIPVIFLTALAKDEHVVQGFESGARGYITKPFDFQDVADSLGTWLRERYARQLGPAR